MQLIPVLSYLNLRLWPHFHDTNIFVSLLSIDLAAQRSVRNICVRPFTKKKLEKAQQNMADQRERQRCVGYKPDQAVPTSGWLYTKRLMKIPRSQQGFGSIPFSLPAD